MSTVYSVANIQMVGLFVYLFFMKKYGNQSILIVQSKMMMMVLFHRTDNHGRYDSSSSPTGQNRAYPNLAKDSLTSSARCTKLRNNLDKMVPSQYIAGMWLRTIN